MAKRDFEKLVLQVRLDTKQKALQQAVLVSWRSLEKSASAYAEWHIFVLWVRVISEFEKRLPDIVVAALGAHCPGFIHHENPNRLEQPQEQGFLWHSLEQWIAVHHFAEAKTDGWFDAVMYYAYKDFRTEQVWSLWERSKDAWSRNRPPRWPTLEEWTAQVLATDSLTQAGTGKARAVEALAKVDPERLRSAVSELLESRAFALWMACICQPECGLGDLALRELHRRWPGFLGASCPQPRWNKSLFLRLVRFGEADWRTVARAERWDAALRYQIIHHPRYHRLLHYNQRCRDEWLCARPHSYPSFAEWLCAADEYVVAPTT